MMKRFCMGAACAAMVGSLLGGVTTVPAGETYVFDIADTSINVEGNVIDLGAGATLKIRPSAVESGFAMYSMASGAPTATADAWRNGISDMGTNFVWDTYLGLRANVSWAEIFKSSSSTYAVLYQGQWNVPGDGDYGFFVNIDDWGYLEIDGQEILCSTNYCKPVATNNVTLTAGWHDIRVILGNGTGNFGATQGVFPGVAYSSANALLTADTVATAGERFEDPGDGSVVRPVFREGSFTSSPILVHIAGTNGAVTVDATACGVDCLRLQGGLRTKGNPLTITGVKQVVFGSKNPTAKTVDYPLFDVGDATFTAEDATGFLFTNQMTLVQLPEMACSIAPEATVAVRGTNTLARFYDDQGRLTLTDWDLYVIENTVVPATTPIRVGAGRIARFKLCDEFEGWRWYGTDGTSATNAIELLDPSASLHLTSARAFNFHGSVTGTGDVWHDGGVNWADSRTEVYAACSQTGTVHVTANGVLVMMDQSTAGFTSNTVDVAADATFAIHPVGYSSNPTTAYIHRVTGDGGTAFGRLCAGNLETVEIGRVEAHMKFDGVVSSRFIVNEVGDDVGLKVFDGTHVTLRSSSDDGLLAVRVPNEGSVPTAELELEEGNLLNRATVEATRTLVLSGTGTVERLVGEGTVRLADGAKIAVREIGSETKVNAGTGQLNVLGPATDWRDKVLLWLDPTAEGSLRSLQNKNGVDQVYTNGYKLIDAWFDRRPEQREWLLLNNRMWTLGSYDLQPQVYPYLVSKGGPNGLPYLSFGTCQQQVTGVGPTGNKTTEARRLQIWKGEIKTTPKTDAEKYSSATVAWVVMVFGSSRGGGQAMLGTDDSYYERAGTNLASPIAKKNFEMYLDGVAASPTNSYFNGGWQLVSFAGNNKVNALDWKNSYQNAGGQDYGEVIFFGTKPTDVERMACERYLAVKWGLAGSVYKGEGAALRLVQGRGEVALANNTDAVLEGSFSGTVTLDGGCLTMTDDPLPPSAAEIPADGRVAWFDANAEGALGMSTQTAAPLAVRVVHSRNNAGVVTTSGNYYLLGTYASGYDRRPWLNEGSRGGVATKWLDFANKYTGDSKGNTLRLFQEPAPTAESSDTAAKSVNVRTAFVALDSSNGGGMPLLDKVNADGQIKAREKTREVTTPIWTNSTVSAVTKGTTRLDGILVAGTTQGYNGRPEVLSLETTANVPLSYFGWYGMDDTKKANAEILGEILLFDRLLSETDRKGVEAYLMKKWAGSLPNGYSDLRLATVTGSGTVRAVNAAGLPKFSESFEGTVELAQTDFSFTLDTRTTPAVADAIAVPCTLDLPAACTISVNCVAKPKPGLYPLLSAQSITGVETLNLNVSGETGPSQLRLVSRAGTLAVEVPATGTMLIFR